MNIKARSRIWVLALIGLLVAILAASVPFLVNSFAYKCHSCQKTRWELAELAKIIDSTFMESDRYPEWVDTTSLAGPVLGSDSWGNLYQYLRVEIEGQPCFMLFTLGSDGKIGGRDIYEKDRVLLGGCKGSGGSTNKEEQGPEE